MNHVSLGPQKQTELLIQEVNCSPQPRLARRQTGLVVSAGVLQGIDCIWQALEHSQDLKLRR